MSEPNERDTKFIKSAQSLMDKLYRMGEREALEQVVARYAYDLVAHVIGSLDIYDYEESIITGELMDKVKDMEVLPSQEETEDKHDK